VFCSFFVCGVNFLFDLRLNVGAKETAGRATG